MNLPVEIITAVREQQCVLFAGPGFAREAMANLGDEIPDDLSLAKALGWTRPKRLMGTRKRRDLPDPAGASAKLLASRGREAVLTVLNRTLRYDEIETTPAHTMAINHFPLIISTSPDELWGKAYGQAGLDVHHRNRGDEIGDITPGKSVLYHLWGRFSQPESVVLDSGSEALPSPVAKQLKKLLRRRVIFFVGYRPDEAHFEYLWQFLSEIYGGELPRCHLAVAQGRIDDYLWQKWVWRGLLMFTADPTDCLDVLEDRLKNE